MPRHTSNRPTPRQMRALRNLAQRTGTSFATPASVNDADREIKRLLNIKGRGQTLAEIDRSTPDAYGTAYTDDDAYRGL